MTRSLQSVVADLEHLALVRTVQLIRTVSDPLEVNLLVVARSEASAFPDHPTLSPGEFDRLVVQLHPDNPELVEAYRQAVRREP